VHTYWPDGTFTFDRNSQSNGFVADVFLWDGGTDNDFVGDKLQYNNFAAPLGWPEWTRYCYRPGVSLLRLEDEEELLVVPPTSSSSDYHPTTTTSNEDGRHKPATPPQKIMVKSVLVCQHLRGLRPPRERDLMERAKSIVKLGESKYFDKRDGSLLPDNDDDDDDIPSREDAIMISKMRLFPLDDDSYNTNKLPPKALVDACRETCHGMRSYGSNFLTIKEDELHTLLTQDIA
jgi:hypothetical protein